MKKNIIALSLLVTCLSTSYRLHAMDSDSEGFDREPTILQEVKMKIEKMKKDKKERKRIRKKINTEVLDYFQANAARK